MERTKYEVEPPTILYIRKYMFNKAHYITLKYFMLIIYDYMKIPLFRWVLRKIIIPYTVGSLKEKRKTNH